MTTKTLTKKIEQLSPSAIDEVNEFIEFLLYKEQNKKHITGLEQAIAEVKRGEVEVFDSFEDFKVAMSQ